MQQRNLMLFFVMVSLLLLIYIPMRQRFMPQPPEPDPAAKKTEVKKKPPREKEAGPVRLPEPVPATAASKLLTLGEHSPDSSFNLEVVLDPLGGGVRAVTLNKFRPADKDGRPGLGDVLELVPADANLHQPSHLLYHFDPRDPETGDPRPLDTLGRRKWEVVSQKKEDGVHTASFRTEIEGVVITKTFTVAEGDYHIGLQVDLQRPKGAKEPIKFRYQLTGAKGLPVEGKWYTSTFRNALIAREDDRGYIDRSFEELRQIDLWGGGYPVSREEGKFIRYAGTAVQYFASVVVVDDEQVPGQTQQFLRRATTSLETGVTRGKIKGGMNGPVDHIVMQSDDGKTSTTIYIPPLLQEALTNVPEGETVAVVYRTLSYDERIRECPKVALDIRTGLAAQATHPMWYDDITVRVATEPATLAPGATVSHKYLLYNGPVKPSLLRGLRGDRHVSDAVVDRYADTLKLNTLTDYHSPGALGRFANTIYWTPLVIKCTNVMHWVLGKIHLVVANYGISIILLTVLVRLMMYPLSRKQAQMSLKMQALQPELKKLKEKYKDNNQEFAQAQMALFRQHGVNPIGSCWVLLLQMPIFMGLYFALQESIQFRLASFWPTWITNLAAPDMLLYWGRSIPIISRDADYGGLLYLGPYLNLLPLFAVGLMVVQQQLMMPPPVDKEQEMQQKMMRIMMIVMGLFFYKIAAGLCIYIITSTLWGFAERRLLPKAKPVGIDTDLDKRIAAAAAAPRGETSPNVAAPSTIQSESRKLGRNKRRADRARAKEDPKTGIGGLRQRLSDWWADVLEQAKKK